MRRLFSDEDQKFINANLFSMSHKQIGMALNRSEQSIRNFCYRRGLVDNSDHWTPEEVELLTAAYQSEFGNEINLPALAQSLGRNKSNVCRKARQLGLTDQKRKMMPSQQRKKRAKFENAEMARRSVGEATKKRIAEKGHPRGMLGKTHSKETKEILAATSAISNANRTDEQKHQYLLKALQTKAKNGTYATERKGTTWKSGWREIGGKRKYFRSRWEANYARYLQWLKERGEISDWEHEPTTFWFVGVKRGCVSYLPDFLVKETSGGESYHEVKGWMDDRSKTKIRRMAKYHPNVKLIVIDSKCYESIRKTMNQLIIGWES